jgi:hypothetical protein
MAQLLDPEQWGRGPRTSETQTSGIRPDAPDADERPPGPRRTGGSAAEPGTRGAETEWDPFADAPPTPPVREPRRGSTPSPAAPRTPSRLPLILIVVLAVLALAAAAVWAAASGLLPLGGGPAQPGAETPAASAPATEEPQPSQSAPAAPAGTPLPASCDDLFSDSMRGTIEGAGLVLNPDWHVASGETRLPSEDPRLQEILGSVERLDCAWLQESPSGVGIYTSISQVTPEQTEAANARMVELGYTAVDELGGVRYVTELSADGNTLGESHFVRDGLWFGTLWINYGPAGYTADMVTQVLG